jgi:integrase
MAALYQRKGGDLWYVDYIYRGKRCRKSTGTSDRELAELHRKDIEVKIERDNLGFGKDERKEVRLAQFMGEYLEFSRAEKAQKTFLIDTRSLKLFKDLVGEIRLCGVSHKQGEDFKIRNLRGMKPVSVNIYLKHLKSAFETAVRWGYIDSNPLKHVKPCKVKNENIPRFFTETDIKKLLDAIPEGEFKRFVIFCLNTGCRRNEALNLKWDDIDMKRGIVIFRVTKSGKSREVPFNGVLTEMLRSMPKTGDRPFPFESDFVTHKFKDYVQASGIRNQNLKLHSLRHTFASHLIMRGVDVMTVSRLLGHSSVRVTEMYAHLVPDHLRASVERLRFE